MNKCLLLIQFTSIFFFPNVQTQQPQLGFHIGDFSTASPKTNIGNQTIIKVALLVAQNTTDFGLARSNAILCNVGGAIPMALERLWNEEILPKSVNFTRILSCGQKKMQSAPIPIFTFSTNPNHYYTSTNDTLTMAVSNAQIGFVLCFQITSLLLLANLLIFAPIFGKLSVKISAVMKLFLGAHTIMMIWGFFTYLQKAFGLWDPRTNFYVVVMIQDISGPYNYMQPYLSLILTVERILIIRFPISFMHYRKYYVRGAAFLTPLIYILTIIWYFFEMPLDPAIVLKSPPLMNTSPKFGFIPQTAVKLITGGLDLFCSAFFFYCLKKEKELAKKIKNRVVKFTIICEILMEVLPAFIYQFVNITKILPSLVNLFVANFIAAMATLNFTLCVLYYNWIFILVAPRERNGQMKITVIKSAADTMAMK